MAVRIGKGDYRRPRFINDAEMERRWKAAFGKKEKTCDHEYEGRSNRCVKCGERSPDFGYGDGYSDGG